MSKRRELNLEAEIVEAFERSGQVTEYRWNMYRDKLSLSRRRGYVYPAMVAAPWTRAD